MIANRRRPGTTSRKSSIRLAARSVDWFDRPVTLPPGRARLATRPVPTGSPADANTIGITDVTCFAAMTFAVPAVTMTSTFRRTNSAAISAARSVRPSAQRYSIARVRPSIQPSSPSRCTRAAVHGRATEAVVGPRTPMVGSFATCCPRAASGHETVPLRRMMNSRRFIRSSGSHILAGGAARFACGALTCRPSGARSTGSCRPAGTGEPPRPVRGLGRSSREESWSTRRSATRTRHPQGIGRRHFRP